MKKRLSVKDFANALGEVESGNGWYLLNVLYADWHLPIRASYKKSKGTGNVVGFGPALVRHRRGVSADEIEVGVQFEIHVNLSDCYILRNDVIKIYISGREDVYPWVDSEGKPTVYKIE